MRKISLNKKVFLFIFTSTLLLSVIILTSLYFNQKISLMKEKERQLKDLVNVSYNMIQAQYYAFKEGKIEEDIAKDYAVAAIKSMRFGDDHNDYFWINDMSPKMIMHPMNTALDGQNVSDIKDKRGTQIFVEFAKIAREKEQGFLNYFWQYKDDKNRVEEKLSYVKHFKDWGWVVGTGVYINDVEEQIWRTLLQMIVLVMIIALITLLIAHFTINRDLSNVAQILANASGLITKAAGEISQGNQSLSERVQEQSSSLEETASTMEEVSSNIKQNADNCQVATQHTGKSLVTVKEGEEVSAKVQKSMKEINDSSRKIADIVNLVEELAFQTNILAINAAIEAAKAGDLGKGFAVVAIEVRDLAQRSSEAAVEIKNLIENSLTKVEEGVSFVDKNSEKFATILETFQKVNDLMAEINSATSEQSSAVEEINKAVTNLDSANQENATHIDQMAGLSQKMAAEAAKLDSLVDLYFR